MKKIALKLYDIHHRFEESSWRLEISALNFKSHQIFGIVGPNGSGKSSLLRIAAGVIIPVSGNIEFGQINLRKLKRKEIARHVGYLPQELHSEYDITVEALISLGRFPHLSGLGSFKATDRDAVHQAIKTTELEAFRSRRLSQLSGGERKRAFLASVLSQEPEILLLDEPTSALDVHYQVQFFRLLKDMSLKGMGIGIVTHDINMASLFCDEIMILSEGKCLAQGRPEKVLTLPNLQVAYGEDIILGRHPEVSLPTVMPRIARGDGG